MSIEKLEFPKRLDEDRIATLKDLFPEIFSDGKVVFGALNDALGGLVEDEDGADEHYGLVWPGKRQAKKLAVMPPTGTLVPVPGEGVDEDTTKNIFIEGDNLEVLRILQKSYANRIKMIYIDPPYNTGQDFIYKDDFKEPVEAYLRRTGQSDEEGLLTSNPRASGRFHSGWLNMMLPRLRLARNLLSLDGAIFISIDDNEAQNLRLLLDEVFGEENFVCAFAWEKRYAPPPDVKDIGYLHETILSYRRSVDFERNLLPITDDQRARYKNPDNDPRGDWKPMDYTCRYTADERPNLYYAIKQPKTGKAIYPKRTRVWAMSRDVHEVHEREHRIWWGAEGNNLVPALKNFLSEIQPGMIPKSLLKHEAVGHTDEATKELREFFPDLKMTPKPTRLIRHLMEIATNSDDDIVMDFFAGSGTTGHAVYAKNVEDGKHRRFILVQLPENTGRKDFPVISEITKQRLRASGKKLKVEKSGDFGFKVFRLAKTSLRKFTASDEPNLARLEDLFASHASAIVDGADTQSVICEISLLEGMPLDSSNRIIGDVRENELREITHRDVGHKLFVCLDKTIFRNTVKFIRTLKPNDVLVCLDLALSDQIKLTLSDTLKIKTL